MLRFTFRGGIHPDDGKAMSKDKPIREVLPKGELVYPLSQHIGAPAKAIVVKGDHVLAGQKIAEVGGVCICKHFCIRIRNGQGDRSKAGGSRRHAGIHCH